MEDPTRIDPTLAALRRAWEGQPEMSLPTLFASLANRGIGWGVSDVELVAELERQAEVHPPLLPLENRRIGSDVWLVLSDSPTCRITIDSSRIIVRRANTQPVVWDYSAIRSTGPGRPFVVTDTEGFEHRLGIVSSIMRLDEPLAGLDGLTRYELGDFVYVLRLEAAIGVLDHGLHLFHKENRRVVARDYAWRRIEKCRPGEGLKLLLEGGEYAQLGKVVEVLIAETPNPLFS
ncbi:hypothetical protein [Corynebacterium macginleyi]|uniref:hypothetical protein n=1 Tax=Corynebacterium macginleyi TaxID=38290 RepID=UPI00190B00FE|nr:hypothetical protein [Corynebacterium macginleyi]MBK4146290.1 hypothetical protein [Corynebacterium macginleyi]